MTIDEAASTWSPSPVDEVSSLPSTTETLTVYSPGSKVEESMRKLVSEIRSVSKRDPSRLVERGGERVGG